MFSGFGNNNATNTGNFLTNLFKPNKVASGQLPATQTITPNLQSSIPNYPYAPYQVSNSDTFESIAKNNNMSVPQIQQANNGMIVPPPSGSVINLPVANVPKQYQLYAQTAQQVARQNQQTVQPMNQNTYTPPNSQASAWLNAQAPKPGGSFTSGSNVNTTELQAQITTQLSNGQLPTSIPYQVSSKLINPLSGRPFTQAEYLASGMTYNNMKKQWENPSVTGAAGSPAAPAPVYDPTPREGKSFDNGKFSWVRKGGRLVLINNKRRKDRKVIDPVAPVAEATNAGTQPSQQLGTNQGGG